MKQKPSNKFLAKKKDSKPILGITHSTEKFIAILAFSLCLSFAGNALAHEDENKGSQSKNSSDSNLHTIELLVEKLDGGYFAYRMYDYVISDMKGHDKENITARFPNAATIPGPTIVINEGDEVDLKLIHSFDPDNAGQEQVSVHVHGVHYDIISDGTLEYINLLQDESATPTMSYEYRWVAAPGTAGTWAYHDHNMNSHNGAEDRGLFGALIVNSRTQGEVINNAGQATSIPLSSIKKDYLLYIHDDSFWGTEINSETGQQTAGGINPTLSAQQGDHVRFHIIALGTNLHQFSLNGYGWVDPGTSVIIGEKEIGPLEKHVFTVQADASSSYSDNTFTSDLLGMRGDFNVTP